MYVMYACMQGFNNHFSFVCLSFCGHPTVLLPVRLEPPNLLGVLNQSKSIHRMRSSPPRTRIYRLCPRTYI